MSLPMMAWVLEHSEATGGARLVLLALAEFAHDDGSRAFPSVETIGHRARMSTRATRSALRKLEQDGRIECTGASKFGTKVYRVLQQEGADETSGGIEGGRTFAASNGAQTSANPTTDPSQGDVVALSLIKGTPSSLKQVWSHYVKVMSPRRKEPDDEQRKIIRAALKVASVGECCTAIDRCRSSAFHMGKNDRDRRYNKLSQILKGRRGHETTRERIDFWLDLKEEPTEKPAQDRTDERLAEAYA